VPRWPVAGPSGYWLLASSRPDQPLTATCYQRGCSAHQTVYREVSMLCWRDGTWHYAVLYEVAHKIGGRVQGGCLQARIQYVLWLYGSCWFCRLARVNWIGIGLSCSEPVDGPGRARVCVCVCVCTALKYLTTAGLETLKLLPSGDNSASIKYSFKSAIENRNFRNYNRIV